MVMEDTDGVLVAGCIPTGIVKFCVAMLTSCPAPLVCIACTCAVKFQSCGVLGVKRSMLVSLDPLGMGSVAITWLTPAGISFTTVVKKLTIAPSIARLQNA